MQMERNVKLFCVFYTWLRSLVSSLLRPLSLVTTSLLLPVGEVSLLEVSLLLLLERWSVLIKGSGGQIDGRFGAPALLLEAGWELDAVALLCAGIELLPL